MVAYGFTVFLYLFFSFLGVGILRIARVDTPKFARFLLGPGIGLSLFELIIFLGNRLGIPVGKFAPTVYLLGITFIFFSVLRQRTHWVTKKTVVVIFITVFGSILTAWPMLKYGFSWLSYGNDDMANYVLAAERFYRTGFFKVPNLLTMNSGSDYAQVYYYFHVVGKVRPGSELFLASVSSFFHGDALKIFMPSIIALNMMLVSATAGLSLTIKKAKDSLSLWVVVAMLVMPLVALGALYQLIGQVGGLLLAVNTLTLFFHASQSSLSNRKAFWALLGLSFSSLLIWYPEIIPFTLVPIAFSFFFQRRGESLFRKKTLWIAVSFLVIPVIFLGQYFLSAFKFLIAQLSGAETVTVTQHLLPLFPYYIIPHGLSSVIGLTPINVLRREPFESIFIGLALLAILGLIFISLRHGQWRQVADTSFLTMTIGALYLWFKASDFGTFKIAMYVQPFLSILIVSAMLAAWGLRNRSTLARVSSISLVVLVLVLFPYVFSTQQFYVQASTGDRTIGFNEIPNASRGQIETKIQNALKTYNPKMGTLIAPTSNVVLAKLEASQSKGVPVSFLTFDYFGNFILNSARTPNSSIYFSDVNLGKNFDFNRFQQNGYRLPTDLSKQYFLLTWGDQSIVNTQNKWHGSDKWGATISSDVQNYLIFISSQDGQAYFGHDRSKIAIYQPEKDPLVQSTKMQALGKEILFQTFRKSPDAKLVVEVSSTLLPQQDRKLPNIELKGAAVQKINLTGHGSARVKSDLFQPLTSNGRDYIQVDIDAKAKIFPTTIQRGLNNLYGNGVTMDSRLFTVFGKDISLVSGGQLANQVAPAGLSHFPQDLQNKALYYSGIYEDGWFSEDSYAWLEKGVDQKLVVKGSVPLVGRDSTLKTEVSLLVDGKLMRKQSVGLGNFEIDVPSSELNLTPGASHKVEIQFSKMIRLPKPDGRPVTARIEFMGFTS